jgi:hypothetical protein
MTCIVRTLLIWEAAVAKELSQVIGQEVKVAVDTSFMDTFNFKCVILLLFFTETSKKTLQQRKEFYYQRIECSSLCESEESCECGC